MTEPFWPVSIGAREIYDQGLETRRVVEKIDAKLDGHAEKLADHEIRIAAIERNRWPLSPAAVVATILAVLSILIQIIPKLLH